VRNDDHIDYSSSFVFTGWRRVGIFSLARVASANHLRRSRRYQGQEVLASAILRQPLVLDDVTKGSAHS
jgi:hypothetical protein